MLLSLNINSTTNYYYYYYYYHYYIHCHHYQQYHYYVCPGRRRPVRRSLARSGVARVSDK